MDMIRHDDITADAPRFRRPPRINDHSDGIGACKYWFAIFAAGREKDNDRFIESFPDRRMRWVSAVFHCLGADDADALQGSTTS